MVWTFRYRLAQFSDFWGKIHTIQMKLVEIHWKNTLIKSWKHLILKVFKIYSNKSCSNQVLRKLVKHHNSQNVKKRLQYSIYNTLWFTPWGVFLTSFNKIHTTFHTKFRLFSTICQVYQGFKKKEIRQ